MTKIDHEDLDALARKLEHEYPYAYPYSMRAFIKLILWVTRTINQRKEDQGKLTEPKIDPIFDIKVKFAPPFGAEPTLRELVVTYYRGELPVAEALEVAETYMAGLTEILNKKEMTR